MFHPRLVKEVRKGYYWLVSDTTALGATGFRVLEGNRNSVFDLIQTTVASQFTLLTDNGGLQARMRKAADSNPTTIATSGSVQAGWTDGTYLAGWFRLPDVSGDISGAGNLFVHTPTAAGQRRVSLANAVSSGDKQSLTTSNDGTTTATNQWLNVFAGGDWTWTECLIVPGTSAELFSGFVLVAHTATAAPPSPLFDGSAPITIGSRAGAGLANVDTTDWATFYYGNGIPSLKNRKRLANYLAPKAVKF